MHESRGTSPADTSSTWRATEDNAWEWLPSGLIANAPAKSPEPLPHPSGHRTRADHARLKERRKRGRKGRGR